MRQVRFSVALKDSDDLVSTIRFTTQSGRIESVLADADTVLYVENAQDVIALLLYCMAVLFDQQRAFIVDNSIQIERIRDYMNHLINEKPTSMMSTHIVRHFSETFKYTANRGDFDASVGLITLKTSRIFARNSYQSKLLKNVMVMLATDENAQRILSTRMPELGALDANNIYQTNVVQFLEKSGKEPTLNNILIFLVNSFIINMTKPNGMYYQQAVDMVLQLLVTHDNMNDDDKDNVVSLFTRYTLLHVTLLYTNKNAPDVYCFAIL